MPKGQGLALVAGSAVVALSFGLAVPARATRPIVEGTGAFKALPLATPRELDDVISKKLTGLQLEDARTRRAILAQAKAWAAFKQDTAPQAQDRYLASCARSETPENPFCRIEAEIATERASRLPKTKSAARENPAVVHLDLTSGDLSRLSRYTFNDLYRGLTRFSDFRPLLPLANRVASVKDCANAALAAAMASKAEEHFPEGPVVEAAMRLYKRSGECTGDAQAMQSRFRFALIAIWKNRCDEADRALAGVIASPEGSVFHSRARYWRHHCAGVTANETLRAEMREALWREHTLTFHNLAVNGNDPRLHAILFDTSKPKIAMRSLIRQDLNTFVRGTEALIEINEPVLAAEIVDRIGARIGSAEPEVRLYLAALMSRAGQALPKFRLLSKLLMDSPRLLSRTTMQLMYPKWFYDYLTPKAKEIDPLLVMALIRQESAFNVNARSSVGARGLMQVMPATARSIASVTKDNLWDPRTNVEVGTKYLLLRLERYQGDVEMTLAAYNAGFSRVDRWIKRYPLENKVLFMDLIPFRETREYVSSILRNYFWYTQLYGNGIQAPATAAAAAEGSSLAATPPPLPAKILAILAGNAGSMPMTSEGNGTALAR